MEWLACRVVTGKEYEIRAKIKLGVPDADIYIPRRYFKEIKEGVVKTRSERTCPGYIFIGSNRPINAFHLKEFMKIIGPVTDLEIANLRAQEGVKEDNFEVGSRIMVIDGPFQGCKGNIKTVNEDGTYKCRVVFQTMEVEANMKPELVSSIA